MSVVKGLGMLAETFKRISDEYEKQNTAQQVSQFVNYALRSQSLTEEEKNLLAGMNVQDPNIASLVLTYINTKGKLSLDETYKQALIQDLGAKTANRGKRTAGRENTPLEAFVQQEAKTERVKQASSPVVPFLGLQGYKAKTPSEIRNETQAKQFKQTYLETPAILNARIRAQKEGVNLERDQELTDVQKELKRRGLPY